MSRRGRPSSRNSCHSSSTSVSTSSKSRRGKSLGGRSTPTVVPSEPDPDRNIYVVENIIDCKTVEGDDERHFFVKWLNYPSSQNSWEPESNLSHDLVVQWDRQHSKVSPRPSTGSESGEAKSKAKKRVLESEKPKNPPSPKEVAPPARQPSGQQIVHKSKMLENIGNITPQRILAMYRETEGDLCYVIERDITVPANGYPASTDSKIQIVSSQVFDTLWPSEALKYFENNIKTSGCLGPLSTLEQKNPPVSNGGGDAEMNSSKDKKKEDESEDDGDDEKEEEYEVQKIVDVMTRGNKRLYYLKWVGYPDSDNTWETEDSLNCTDLLDAFWAARPEADPRKKKKVSALTSAVNNAAAVPVVRRPEKLLAIQKDKDCREFEVSKEHWRFLVKWQADTIPTAIPYNEARSKWPMLVLGFFQKHLEG